MNFVRINRRRVLAAAAMAASVLAGPSGAAGPRADKSKVHLVVGGQTSFHHLPLVLADQLGYFRSEGLSVEITDAGNPARALQLMADGGFDVCAGPYEHTLMLQGRGQLHQAFVVQARTPQVAFGLSTRGSVREIADLRGKRIGLAQAGTVDAMVATQVLTRAGLRPDEVSLIELGPSNSAATAVRSGVVDALSHFDPVMTLLEQRGEVKILADTRTSRGTLELFGALLPSSCLHATTEFVQKNPAICQALTHAVVHALKWLQTAGPGDLIKTVPDHYFQGDRALYLASFMKVRGSLSPDGLMPADGAQAALQALLMLNPALRVDRTGLLRSYTNEFARKAKDRFKA
jgi:NitT/TauT family transport system substrate-binding protein